MTRLVDDSGCSITGGAAQVGRFGATCCRRSWTSWRERMRSVPGSKIISICDSWPSDLDRSTSRFGHAVQRLLQRDGHQGLGLLAATSPRVTVWISTFGGANSGKTSTGIWRSCAMPKSIMRPAERDDEEAELDARRDDPAHHRSLDASRVTGRPVTSPAAPAALLADAELEAPELRRPDGHDRGARPPARSASSATSPSMRSISIGSRRYTRPSAVRVHPRRPVRLVDDRGEGHLQRRPARALVDRGRLDVEPLGGLIGEGDAADLALGAPPPCWPAGPSRSSAGVAAGRQGQAGGGQHQPSTRVPSRRCRSVHDHPSVGLGVTDGRRPREGCGPDGLAVVGHRPRRPSLANARAASGSDRRAEPQVERRHHEQADERGGDRARR